MPKHNNVIPNGHFHKAWQNNVRTWFDQPARKLRRRQARQAKAQKIFPRPVAGALRPAVRAQTQKYNSKIRLGRGFTLEELKVAGINRNVAPTIGIAVDHRRTNRSEKSLRDNVQRLKEYKSKLVVFPRNAKKPKAGDSKAEDLTKATQLFGTVQPIKSHRPSVKVHARAITEAERKTSVFTQLRRARADARLVGIRKKRAAAAADAKPAASS
jgi:large subunit ribosomal protein L13e